MPLETKEEGKKEENGIEWNCAESNNMMRKALGSIKDHSSIGLAKLTSVSLARFKLDVAVVKATRHDEIPADEKHIRDIIRLTRNSRARTTACVTAISRRLSNTHCWAVALKALVLVHRLLMEGNPEYEREFFYAKRRRTRLLNMSDFRDTSAAADPWDLSGFVRTFALYLDTRLEYRMHSRPNRRVECTCHGNVHGIRISLKTGRFELESRCPRHFQITSKSGEDDVGDAEAEFSLSDATAQLHKMSFDRIFIISLHLLDVLERFLLCRPTTCVGLHKAENESDEITEAVENNRIVLVALSLLVKESYQTYYGLLEIMRVLDEQLEKVSDFQNLNIRNVFLRASRLLDELELFYQWCKKVGVGQHSEYPEVDTITWKKRFVTMNESRVKKLTSM